MAAYHWVKRLYEAGARLTWWSWSAPTQDKQVLSTYVGIYEDQNWNRNYNLQQKRVWDQNTISCRTKNTIYSESTFCDNVTQCTYCTQWQALLDDMKKAYLTKLPSNQLTVDKNNSFFIRSEFINSAPPPTKKQYMKMGSQFIATHVVYHVCVPCM